MNGKTLKLYWTRTPESPVVIRLNPTTTRKLEALALRLGKEPTRLFHELIDAAHEKDRRGYVLKVI